VVQRALWEENMIIEGEEEVVLLKAKKEEGRKGNHVQMNGRERREYCGRH
jgi:hypothetical protein